MLPERPVCPPFSFLQGCKFKFNQIQEFSHMITSYCKTFITFYCSHWSNKTSLISMDEITPPPPIVKPVKSLASAYTMNFNFIKVQVCPWGCIQMEWHILCVSGPITSYYCCPIRCDARYISTQVVAIWCRDLHVEASPYWWVYNSLCHFYVSIKTKRVRNSGSQN